MEGVEDGPRFLKILKQQRKKAGYPLESRADRNREPGGDESYGSLSGAAEVWNSTLKQAGVVQVGSAEEMIDAIYAFLYLPPNAGPRVALLGGGGAIGVAASDSLDRLGLSVPVLSPPILESSRLPFPRWETA